MSIIVLLLSFQCLTITLLSYKCWTSGGATQTPATLTLHGHVKIECGRNEQETLFTMELRRVEEESIQIFHISKFNTIRGHYMHFTCISP